MPESVWPEQEAAEQWWLKHRKELKESVTEERLKLQDLAAKLQAENDVLRSALEPFAALNTSREYVDISVHSINVTRARKALQYHLSAGEPH